MCGGPSAFLGSGTASSGGEGGGGDLLSKQTGEHSMYEYKKCFYELFICVVLYKFGVFFVENRPSIKAERLNHINN